MNKYMELAIREALEGIEKGHGGPFGSVIVKDGVIIGRGHNRVLKDNDPTCHGEVAAIRDACKNIGSFDLTGATIYTTGEPCPMCRGAILWSNISKIYYGCTIDDNEDIGFRDKQFYEEMERKNSDRFTCLDRNECLDLFHKYKNIADKKNY